MELSLTSAASKSSANRQRGAHQVEQQRAAILDAAEALFLRNGLENTSMIDIAARAAITRVTLYRYFANRDEIALAIMLRMMRKIDEALPPAADEEPSLEGMRRRAAQTIRNFNKARDAYRYMGMFDRVYLDHAPGDPLAQWTRARLQADFESRRPPRPDPLADCRKELSVIFNAVIWFLEKLALRGELTWSDPRIPLDEHLRFFEEMIMRSFDLLEQTRRPQNPP